MKNIVRKKAGGDGGHQLQIALKSIQDVDWRDKNILDLGSSNGLVTFGVLKATDAGTIIGLEIDSNRVDRAIEIKNQNNEGRLEFCQGDISNLAQFDNASFDGVFSNIVFQQLKEKLHDVLCEAYRVLKPGGEAIINFNQEKSAVTLEFQKLVKNDDSVSSAKSINSELFRAEAEKAGFKIESCSAEYDTYYYDNVDDLIGTPKKSSMAVKDVVLSPKKEIEIWEKLRQIFLQRKTTKGFEETWNIVCAKLIK